MAAPIDASGLIPQNISNEVLAIVGQESGVLKLARTVPVPAGVTQLPVQTSLPKASWVTAPGGRKAYTDLGFRMVVMPVEEVAAVVAIADTYLEDSAINLWNFVKPQLAQSIRTALDLAVLFGEDAPASFPAGGIVATAIVSDPGVDAVDGINNAMSDVEAQGLPVTGHDADMAVKGLLRGVRDANGALLLGQGQTANGGLDSIYGEPVVWGQFPIDETINFITGDWDALTVGVRQDIRYKLSTDGVIADATGKVQVTGFQDNVTLMKVWARYGVVLIQPPTQRNPAGAKPFAVNTLTKAAVTPPAGGATLSVDAEPSASDPSTVQATTTGGTSRSKK